MCVWEEGRVTIYIARRNNWGLYMLNLSVNDVEMVANICYKWGDVM